MCESTCAKCHRTSFSRICEDDCNRVTKNLSTLDMAWSTEATEGKQRAKSSDKIFKYKHQNPIASKNYCENPWIHNRIITAILWTIYICSEVNIEKEREEKRKKVLCERAARFMQISDFREKGLRMCSLKPRQALSSTQKSIEPTGLDIVELKMLVDANHICSLIISAWYG